MGTVSLNQFRQDFDMGKYSTILDHDIDLFETCTEQEFEILVLKIHIQSLLGSVIEAYHLGEQILKLQELGPVWKLKFEILHAEILILRGDRI
ncbi:MAG: hypothetical protein ACXAE3_08135 [Candidatus Kariarchaeaceae archaeon]|jgi:hypothetical protein